MENWNEIKENVYNDSLNNPEQCENSQLVISPVAIRTARAFVAWTHRYLAPPVDAELITYTCADEPGTSLRAAGYRQIAHCPPRPGWDTPSRPRASRGADSLARVLWEVTAPGGRP